MDVNRSCSLGWARWVGGGRGGREDSLICSGINSVRIESSWE